jgi:hypothetical protein
MARSDSAASETVIDFPATIARLRSLAAQAGDALLTEGPVTPDRVLLDTCADALHLFKHAQMLGEQRSGFFNRITRPTEAERATHDALFAQEREATRRAGGMLVGIKKIRAQTPAGIYAKAMVVRCSVSGAAHLAKSLAEDLLACEGLRATLWPSGRDTAPA